MRKYKFKPCPKCKMGNCHCLVTLGGGKSRTVQVECANCDHRGPERKTEHAAIEAWDKESSLPATP